MPSWSRIADWILGHPKLILGVATVVTILLGAQALQIRTDHTAGQFLSSESDVVRDFRRASKVFGQSQTVLYAVLQGADPFDPAFLQALDTAVHDLEALTGIDHVLSLTNIPRLVRDDDGIRPEPLYDPTLDAAALRERIENQPFLKGLLLSEDGTTTVLLVNIEDAFNDTPERVDLVDAIEARLEELPGEVAMAGFPHLRSKYAQRVTSEAPLFTLLAVLVSLLFLFITFRARRAVFLPLLVAVLGIVWTLGLIALFNHRLNIVTSVLPALLVIIGIANSIHITTKFYNQYERRQNLREALLYTIHTVGLATFLTSFTTAIGFAVLTLSGSQLLSVFGVFAAIGIMLLYVLAITLIPLILSLIKPPADTKTRLATHDSLGRFFDHVATFTRDRAGLIMILSFAVVAVGIYGTSRISSDIYVFSDFYEDDPLRQDLAVFEEAFGGVLPLEVIIEAHTQGRFQSLGNLRRLERLEQQLAALEPVGLTLAATDFVRLANQAYFGGHPRAYRLPAGYEMPFLQAALQDLLQGEGRGGLTTNLPRVVDSTFTITRIYLGVTDIGTQRMNALADTVTARATQLFPPDQFDVVVTGTAIVNTRSGENLVRNLLGSLGLALLLISVLMALLFRSARLTLISLVPNVIPLLIVGGTMGFGGIILKPSTALIFPLAFGIAVDATIHFLAKYRLLRDTGMTMDEAIHMTLQETGKALLFASLILTSGFLVFTLSSFGGTVNMGALTALTLAVALISNVLLLPALLYRFGPQEHHRTTTH